MLFIGILLVNDRDWFQYILPVILNDYLKFFVLPWNTRCTGVQPSPKMIKIKTRKKMEDICKNFSLKI